MSRRTWMLIAGGTAIALAAGVVVALLIRPAPRDTSLATPSGSVVPSATLGTPASATPEATTAATTAATATASPPPPAEIELAEGDIVRAVVDDLRVRMEPSSDADTSHALSIGEEAVVVGGPEVADGYQWFEVRQGPSGATGWVASGTQDGPWLARVTNGWLAGTVFTDSREGQLIAVAPDGSEQRVLADGTVETSFAAAFPRWSPSGTELLTLRTGAPEDRGVYRLPAEGGEPVRIGSGRADAAWSPDGSFVAMGVEGGIEVVDAAGESRLIELELETPFSIWWSPDGGSLAFAASDPDPQIDEPYRLFTVPAEGGEPTPITGHGYYHLAGWSPDGTRIAYVEFTLSAGPPWTLHVVDPDGGNDATLTEVESSYENCDCAWSPDGSGLLAVVEDRIVIVDPVGGSTRVVARLPEGQNGILAAWSPDGRVIAAISMTDPPDNSEGERHVSVVNVDGSGMQGILEGARQIDWQPVLGP